MVDLLGSNEVSLSYRSSAAVSGESCTVLTVVCTLVRSKAVAVCHSWQMLIIVVTLGIMESLCHV